MPRPTRPTRQTPTPRPAKGAAVEDADSPYPATLPRPRDLTPAPRRTIDPDQVALTPDGATVIAAVRCL